MSKIQDALQKIQSAGNARAPKEVSTGDTSQVAAIVLQPATDHDDPATYDG